MRVTHVRSHNRSAQLNRFIDRHNKIASEQREEIHKRTGHKLQKVLEKGVSFETIVTGATQEGKEHPEFIDSQVYEIALDHLLEDKNAYR